MREGREKVQLGAMDIKGRNKKQLRIHKPSKVMNLELGLYVSFEDGFKP